MPNVCEHCAARSYRAAFSPPARALIVSTGSAALESIEGFEHRYIR